MAEYIEREAIMKFPIRKGRCDKEHANEHFIFGIESVMEYAELLPTVDAEVVVRCKDCKFRNTLICPMVHETMGNGTTDYATDDGYCNRGSGKRKDGA